MATEIQSPKLEFNRSHRVLWIALLLATVMGVGMWVYRDVGAYPFVQFDDPALVSGNPYVNRGITADSLRWAFSFQESEGQRAEPLASELWAPLSFVSLALDVQLAGVDPGFHHRVNLCLHLVSTCLAFLFFLKLTRVPLAAGAIAAVFCFHPMHVESVVWISERKDVLSGMLVFCTLNLYLAWKLRDGGRGRVLWWGALLCFALACLAKPGAVVTPLLLLWIDGWLARDRPEIAPADGGPQSLLARLKPKLPFFVIMAAAAAMTLAMKLAHSQAPQGPAASLWYRLLEMPVALLFYLERTVSPKHLFAYYERYPYPYIPGALIGVALITLLSWGAWRVRKQAPEWCFGWGWFLICLLPVLGFAYAGPSFTADRYTYLAHCGLAFALVMGMTRLVAHRPRWLVPVMLLNLFYLFQLAGRSREGVSVWQDSGTLFHQGVAVQPRSAKNWHNLGSWLIGQGDLKRGTNYLKRSIEIGGEPDAYYNLAATQLEAGGDPNFAAILLRECIRLDPKNSWAMQMLAGLLDDPEAINLYDPEESRRLIGRARELQQR